MAATARQRSPSRDRRPLPAGAGGKIDESRPGLASTPPCSCGRRRPRDPYPTTTPPRPFGGASSISFRKRRTRLSQHPALSHRRSRQPRRHWASGDPGRAWRLRPNSVRAAENLAITTPQVPFEAWDVPKPHSNQTSRAALPAAPTAALRAAPQCPGSPPRTGQLRERILRDRRRSGSRVHARRRVP